MTPSRCFLRGRARFRDYSDPFVRGLNPTSLFSFEPMGRLNGHLTVCFFFNFGNDNIRSWLCQSLQKTGSCTAAASAVRLNHFPATFRLTIRGFQARIIPVTTLEIERFQRLHPLVPRYARQKCFCCGKEGTLCLSRSAA